MRVAILLVGALGCGRIGFGTEVGGDGAPADGTTVFPDAPACVGTTARLPLDNAGGQSWVMELRAARTADGFSVTYIAPDAVAFGVSYAVQNGVASTIVEDTEVDNPAMRIGSASLGSTILVVSETTTATTVRPYTRQLTAMGTAAAHNAQHAFDRSLVTNADDSQATLLTFGASTQVDGVRIGADGRDIGASFPLVAASETASALHATSAGPDVLLTWRGSTGALRIARVTSTAMPAATTLVDVPALQPAAAWGTTIGRGVAVWAQTGQSLWAQRFDASLAPIGPPIQLPGTGSAPRVASDGYGFWVAWRAASSSMIEGARISATGEVTPFTVPDSGGMAVDHDLVTLRNGTVELVWMERNTTGEPLWVIPACTL